MPNSKIRKYVYRILEKLEDDLVKGVLTDEQHRILEQALFNTIPDLDLADDIAKIKKEAFSG